MCSNNDNNSCNNNDYNNDDNNNIKHKLTTYISGSIDCLTFTIKTRPSFRREACAAASAHPRVGAGSAASDAPVHIHL